MEPVATITLTLRKNGELDVSGPTANRLVFLGMLELARDSVNHYHHEASKLVQPAGPRLAEVLKGSPR
jgi:hypothetical protein